MTVYLLFNLSGYNCLSVTVWQEDNGRIPSLNIMWMSYLILKMLSLHIMIH